VVERTIEKLYNDAYDDRRQLLRRR